MSILKHQSSCRQIETVIDLAVALNDYTQSPERCREIPAFLAESLAIEDLTMAVVRRGSDAGAARIVMCNASRESGDEQKQIVECQLLDAHRRYQFESPDGRSEFAHILYIRNASMPEDEGKRSPAFGTVVFARTIDKDHDLLLMIRRAANSADLQFEIIEDLQILTNELSKQMQCMIAWQRSRTNLCKPFSDLSDQEWQVLRSLTSGASEKQLAGQLNMNPHAFHSRIKSIYRKLGVQGRLPMIQKLNAAVSEMRINIHRTHNVFPDTTAETNTDAAQQERSHS